MNPSTEHTGHRASRQPVIIACAMEEEAQPFLEALGQREPVAEPPGFQGPLQWVSGRLDATPVIVATTGIGMTNAALAATVLITRFRPRAVIFAGTTGGLGARIQLGDVVVGSTALYHDADASAFGYAPGQIPRMPELYEANAALVTVVEGALRKRDISHQTGQISASNSFVFGPQVGPVRSAFPGVLAVDMETAAGAQVCWAFRTPWISLRAVSDMCDPDAGGVFDASAPTAYQRSFEAVRALLQSGI